ncbi:MAG: hypothetical protein COW32_07785 [Candidatus Aquicultor secundus]|uniref:Thioredoxin domain-containing protein n=1 Tax=Candidatus Aquicultor secundus TaxID=1973895 RepID=A0A2M7TAL9_9ACTN|nr:thioredoxin domain-containing protein [Candidatus Aquicultor secundus]NCO66782.1 thioredoxin fold domain-containing protein [Solirubrobacter sp.]OIO87901.1 MAG: hypothetical protein AUK32_02800 [Candidatus Aquicultor secundus]PIU26672.1 MAG: hypothetical protein COT10_07535 [Candidatus Aquicultor secundus]PIW21848.1 MAG: hypothetical protein COW32_07785 [Candidatus Aquicultor secundus]PIX52183.1 MAG: hypothetical protein COZ51_05555 [Candidatus Aquicultor secundus]
MSKSTLGKIVVVIAVVVVAALIIYQKTSNQQVSSGQATSSAQNVCPAPVNQSTGQASQTLSPGEAALQAGLKSGKPTTIVFRTNSCAPCKEMAAIIAQIRPEYEKRVNIIEILVDDQAEQRLINQFGVNTIPTSVFYDKTGKSVGRQIGVIEKDKLTQLLTALEK